MTLLNQTEKVIVYIKETLLKAVLCVQYMCIFNIIYYVI